MALYATLPKKNYLCKSCDKKDHHCIMECPTKLNEIPLKHQWSNFKLCNPINVVNLKMICKGKNPIAFKGNINISNVSKLANLEQDEMLKIATWKNDSICPINEKILTDYIEFPVAYFGLDYHKLFGFCFKFDISKSTLYVKVQRPLPKFYPKSMIQIKYDTRSKLIKIDQVFKKQ